MVPETRNVGVTDTVGDGMLLASPACRNVAVTRAPTPIPSSSITLKKVMPIITPIMSPVTLNGQSSLILPVLLPLKPMPNPRVS